MTLASIRRSRDERLQCNHSNPEEDSDHESAGAKLRMVLPDSEAEEEDDAGGGALPAGSPGCGDTDERD